MTFGKRLMQLRKEHGYRNRDTFAAELGIPANTLRNCFRCRAWHSCQHFA